MLDVLRGRGLADVGNEELLAAARAHGITSTTAPAVFAAVFARAMENALADEVLTDDELTYLDGLRGRLGVTDDDAHEAYASAAGALFQAAAQSGTGHSLSTDQLYRLQRFAEQLRVPDVVVQRAYLAAARPLLEAKVGEISADRRISPYEERGLTQLAAQLGIDLRLEGQIATSVERFRLLWRIENGELPTVEAPFALRRGEVCHFGAPAQWHELRTRTVRTDYAGPVGSIRIAKGVRFRVGSVSTTRLTRTELTPIDTGRIFFTSSRVVFLGGLGNKTIAYSTLLGLELFSDALRLEKASGKSPYLFLDDLELAAVTLGALIATA